MSNKVKYGLVEVLLDDGTTGQVYIGGSVEVHYDAAHDTIKAFVKKKIDTTPFGMVD